MKSLLITLLALVLGVGLFYLVFMSPYSLSLLDKVGPSRSMQESRDRGVYLFQYKVLNPDHYINDSTELHIRQAWIERVWDYGRFRHQTVQSYDAGYILCVVDSTSRSDQARDYAPSLHRGGEYLGGFTYHDHQLFFDTRIDGVPPDSILIPIVIGDFKKPDTVGTLHLVFEDGRPQ